MVYVIKFLYSWVLPPACFVVALIWLAWRLRRRDSALSCVAGLLGILMYAASIQPVSEALLRPLEYWHPFPLRVSGDSILLLGGGSLVDVPLPENWSGQVQDVPAQRVIAAYTLHRRTGWPVIVSGGEVFRGEGREAVVMRDVLTGFGMDPGKIIMEDKSLNTEENAVFSATILKQRGYYRPVLITSAFHMPRSVSELKRAGVEATPYPTGYYVSRQSHWNALSWVPTFSALRGTGLALKEYMGLAALQVRNKKFGDRLH